MEQFGTTALGALFGAFGYWLIVKLYEWWQRPRPSIQFGEGYPFRSQTKDQYGRPIIFLSVGIRNGGRTTARNCKAFVRKIRLDIGTDNNKELESDFPMQTAWVPRESGLNQINIPRKMEFYANIVSMERAENVVKPTFEARFAWLEEFSQHFGNFELEVVLAGDNFDPVVKRIRFSHPKDSTDLIPAS